LTKINLKEARKCLNGMLKLIEQNHLTENILFETIGDKNIEKLFSEYKNLSEFFQETFTDFMFENPEGM
jgi:hypothetical protein